MNAKLKQVLLLYSFIFCLGAERVMSQVTMFQSDLVFENLGIKEGISHPVVNCVFRDSRGFLWIATEDGLDKYDGISFTVYKHNALNENSLADNQVFGITEDNEKNLWIGTQTGLSVFNLVSERFTNYYADPKNPHSLKTHFKLRTFVDRSGTVWLTAIPKFLGRFNKERKNFDYYELPDDQMSISMLQKEDGKYLVTSSSALYSFDVLEGFKKLINLDTLVQRPYGCTFMHEDANHMIWIGSWGGGVAYYNPQTQQIKNLLYEPKPLVFGMSNIFRDISETRESNNQITIWLASSYGLIRVPIINKQYPTEISTQPRYAHDDRMPYGIIGGGITSVVNMGGNRMVIGSTTGISIINPEAQKISSAISRYPGTAIQLYYDASRKKIWRCNWYGPGVLLYDINTMMSDLLAPIPSANRQVTSVSAVAKEDENNYWIGTMGGLYRYNFATKKYTPFLNDPKDSNTINSDRIYCLLKDSKKRLWIGTYGKGVNLLLPGSNKFQHFINDPSNEHSMAANLVWTIFEDSRGNIWIGTDAGLVKYNESGNDFITYKSMRNNKSTLLLDQVTALAEDGNGNLWVGSTKGVSKLVHRTGRFVQYTTADGLFNANITGLTKDSLGNIWLSTSNGLSCFDINKEKFFNYSAKEGILEPQGLSTLTTAGTNVLVAFGNNIMSFDPRDLIPDDKTPVVFINNFSVFDKKISFSNFIDSIGVINLGYEQNFFSFDFISPDIIKGRSIQYAYMLEGADKDWVMGDRRQANYTNIDGGKYIFKVKARYSGGQWGTPTIVQVIITPPFWETWWFMTLMAMVCALIGYAVHYLVMSKLIAMERIRNKIARDLHDDVGSTLSTINILSQMAKSKAIKDPNRTLEFVSQIGESSQKMMEAMDDIVWSVKPENDSMQKILARMREFAANVLEAKNIQYNFTTGEGVEDMKLGLQERKDFYLIFKEAVNNLAKYSGCGQVSIILELKNHKLDMTISDDGIGFDSSAYGAGNGLFNMKKRAEAMNGVFSIQSSPGKGTVVRLTLL